MHQCLPENALEHLPLGPPPPAANINRRRNCSDSKKGLKRRYQNTHKVTVDFGPKHMAEKRSCSNKARAVPCPCMRRYQKTLPVSEMRANCVARCSLYPIRAEVVGHLTFLRKRRQF